VDLLYFVLLTSILIFIHESGHFVFAKIFGVKVITFSIGFGPKLLRLRGKETEYCVGLLPFGGFVKMLEEGKAAEPIPPEDRRRTFEAQALWKRVVIVLAGPAMNVVFPVALYTSVYLDDRMLPPPSVGVVVPGLPAEGKLFSGDRIVAVDGSSVSTFTEVQREASRRIGVPLRLSVDRDGKNVDVEVTPADEERTRELDIVEHVGMIGIGPRFLAPVVGIARVETPAWRAGLRTFDRVVSVNGRRIDRLVDLVNLLAQNRGETVVLNYLRPVPSPIGSGLCETAVMEPGEATLTPVPRGEGVVLDNADARARDVLARTGIESTEMYVAGDRITDLDGVAQRSWKAMEKELVRGASKLHDLAWVRPGETNAGRFQLRKEQWNDEFSQHYERYVFRTTHWTPNGPDQLVPNPRPIIYALRGAVEETGSVIRFISVGFVRILQGRISISTVSGPITLYDVAGEAGARGTTYFVWAMAVISINLGLVNLLPIPVLDGGHLVFLALEAVKKRPISLRVREVASLVGMSVLFLLMLVAFKNDVERRWDVILGQIRDIFG